MTRDEGNPSGAPKRNRFRFNLSTLLWFVVLIAVALGLVAHLRHVGFVVACFIAGIAAGWWTRRWGLSAASLTALLVFTVTYLVFWVQLGSYLPEFVQADLDLRYIGEALSKYAEATGHLPDSLGEMTDLEGDPLRYSRIGQRLDYWHHPYHYQKKADGFELASLGRDGKIGGVGLDADIFLGRDIFWIHPKFFPVSQERRAKARLPLSQFLFDTLDSGWEFMAATVASIASASIWLIVTMGLHIWTRRYRSSNASSSKNN